MWEAFLNKGRLSVAPPGLQDVVEEIASFLLPPIEAVAGGHKFHLSWAPEGPWKSEG